MKKAILFLLLTISIACQAQVNVTGKSFRIMNSDSTHGEINNTEYVTSAGYYRYKENGVWYYRASTADIASSVSTASNGLTKTSNDIRLGGALTQNTSITGAFSLTLEPQNLNLNATNAVSGTAASFGFTSVGGDFTLNIGDDIILQSTPPNNNSVTQILGRNSGTGAIQYKDLSSFSTIGGTIASTQVGYGSGANTLTSEAAFTYTAGSNLLSVDNIASATGGNLALSTGASFTVSATNDVSLNANTGDITLSATDDIIISNLPVTNNALTTLLGRNSSTGVIEERTVASLSTSPAGSDTQIQYNNSGAFGAEAAFAYDATNNTLTVDQIVGGTSLFLGPTASSSTGVYTNNFLNIGNTSSAHNTSTIVASGSQSVIELQLNDKAAGGITLASSGGDIILTSSNTGSGDILIGSTTVGTATGDIVVTTNAATGKYFIILNLPTSSAGLPSGAVYSNVGVLTIVP